MTMPTVNIKNIENLSDEETKILNVVVKKNQTIRASKPNVKDKTNYINGKASYVWRMVCFIVSPKPAHQCMPVCANFDFKDDDWTNRRQVEKDLQVLIDKIIDAVDMSQWHGVHRWGKALGY